MTIFTHGSDLSLAPTVGPVVRQLGLSLISAVERLAALGFGAVQLDITLPGVRPRDLSPVARRDLLAMLARRGLTLAGLDLFIPRKDFLDDARIDRAMSAALAGIELAASLGRVAVSIPLPVRQLDGAALATLVEAAEGRGVTLAVHAEDQTDTLFDWIERVDLPALGAALDPAAILATAASPSQWVHRHAARLATARLSDFAIQGGGDEETRTATGLRCPVGQGDLDVIDYRLALDLASARRGPVVLDLRNMENVLAAATTGLATWQQADLSPSGPRK